MKLRVGCVVIGFSSLVLLMAAQTSGSSPAAQVPPLIQFSHVATDEGGNSLSGVVSISFSLYNSQQGGSPLWTEIQKNIQLDPTGHYSVQLGITKPNGVPTTLFTSGEARWLGVQIAGQAEQPRVLLLSVPYALKAGDAATLGGLPSSAFVLAAPPTGSAAAESAGTASATSGVNPNVGGTGTADFIPLWTDGTGDLGNSVMFQSGTGSTAKIGINTTTPATALDVRGRGTIRGQLSMLGTLALPATGPATATVGKNSQPLNLTASAFSSITSTAVNQTFQWQAEPASNDTSTPSGTLNLLFGEGATTPSETGLNIASNGQITFATGQTFPGTPGLATANTFTADQTVNGNVSASQFISTVAQGTAPLQIASTTQVPNLDASYLGGLSASAFQPAGAYASLGANTFTATQTINADISLPATTSDSTQGVISIGAPFLHNYGPSGSGNIFLGLQAGNFSTTGTSDTAVGYQALQKNISGSENTANGSQALAANLTGQSNTATGYAALAANNAGSSNTADGYQALTLNNTGGSNTAIGYSALNNNTMGSYNTAGGYYALLNNGTGSYNTALGFLAGPDSSNPNLTNATALGANAVVSASNTLVLGSTSTVTQVGLGVSTVASAHFLDTYTGAYLTMGGAWTNSSDRDRKRDFKPVDGHAVLKRLAVIPIQTWSYKQEDATIRHMGPMAQEFHRAFALGDDDKHISTVDSEGVALAAIQALYQVVQEKDGQIRKLKKQVEELQRARSQEATTVERRLARIEAQVRLVQLLSTSNEACAVQRAGMATPTPLFKAAQAAPAKSK